MQQNEFWKNSQELTIMQKNREYRMNVNVNSNVKPPRDLSDLKHQRFAFPQESNFRTHLSKIQLTYNAIYLNKLLTNVVHKAIFNLLPVQSNRTYVVCMSAALKLTKKWGNNLFDTFSRLSQYMKFHTFKSHRATKLKDAISKYFNRRIHLQTTSRSSSVMLFLTQMRSLTHQ